MSCLPHLEACVVPSDTMKASPKTHIQVIYRLIRLHLGIYIYMKQQFMTKEAMHLKENKEGYMGGFGGNKRKLFLFTNLGGL